MFSKVSGVIRQNGCESIPGKCLNNYHVYTSSYVL